MADWVILGCGYVGTRLAKALLADGHRVRVAARNVQRLEPLGALGAEVHRLDAARLRFGPALYGLRAPTVVYSIPPVADVPVGEPVSRAAEAAMQAGAARFLYLGSTAVYGETEHGVTVDEESPIATFDAQAAPRIGEETAVETARLSGLSTVILRLAAIYGPGRGVRERLKAGTYRLTDDGIHYFSRVHVDDLVGIIRAAAARAPAGARYCVADDRPSTQREYAEWLCGRLGLPLPPSVPSIAPGAPRRAVRNRKVSNARLKRELGYAFRYPSFVEGELAIEAETDGPPAAAAPAEAAPAPVVDADGDGLARLAREVEARWLEAVAGELASVVAHVEGDRFAQARAALARVAAVAELLERQRRLLAHAQAPDLAPLAAKAGEVWAAFERALARHGAQPETLARDGAPETLAHAGLIGVAAGLAEVDLAVQRYERAPAQPRWFPSLARWSERVGPL